MTHTLEPRTDTVEERLAALCTGAGGRLTAEAVLEDARNPESPLHSHFEWDDSIAAEKHRLDTARSIIRSVRVEVKTEQMQMRVVAYVRDPDAERDEQGYVAAVTLQGKHERSKTAMRGELKRVLWNLERARNLAIFLGLDDEVGRVVTEIEQLELRVEALG